MYYASSDPFTPRLSLADADALKRSARLAGFERDHTTRQARRSAADVAADRERQRLAAAYGPDNWNVQAFARELDRRHRVCGRA